MIPLPYKNSMHLKIPSAKWWPFHLVCQHSDSWTKWVPFYSACWYIEHFVDDVFKFSFLHGIQNVKISLRFVPKFPINNNPALVQIMAWCIPGTKPLSEPMMAHITDLRVHIYTSLGLVPGMPCSLPRWMLSAGRSMPGLFGGSSEKRRLVIWSEKKRSTVWLGCDICPMITESTPDLAGLSALL